MAEEAGRGDPTKEPKAGRGDPLQVMQSGSEAIGMVKVDDGGKGAAVEGAAGEKREPGAEEATKEEGLGAVEMADTEEGLGAEGLVAEEEPGAERAMAAVEVAVGSRVPVAVAMGGVRRGGGRRVGGRRSWPAALPPEVGRSGGLAAGPRGSPRRPCRHPSSGFFHSSY
jgi:hypothetical protein